MHNNQHQGAQISPSNPIHNINNISQQQKLYKDGLKIYSKVSEI